MTSGTQHSNQPGRTRKRLVILALFAVAIAFYVVSFFVVTG